MIQSREEGVDSVIVGLYRPKVSGIHTAKQSPHCIKSGVASGEKLHEFLFARHGLRVKRVSARLNNFPRPASPAV